MCYRAVVLEVKENYCIVMLDDSQIVRIKKKEGVREGQKIYVLEEDFYQEESKNGAVVIPFRKEEQKKRKGIRKSTIRKMAAAAAAFLIFVSVATSDKIFNPVYATVSFDGDQSVQLELDKDNRVLSAKSYDKTISEDALKSMKGKDIDELWDLLRSLSDDGESILVASAAMNKRAMGNEEALEKYIHLNLENEKLICLRGDQDDVKGADDARKSLGIYILEKAMEDDTVRDYLGDVPYGQGNIYGFLDRLKEKYPDAYEQLLKMDDDFDIDVEDEAVTESEESEAETEIEEEAEEEEKEEVEAQKEKDKEKDQKVTSK